MTILEELASSIGRRLSGAGQDAHHTVDGALLCDLQDTAQQATEAARSSCERMEAIALQQRTALDAAADGARVVDSRGRDLQAAAEQVREALERTRLVALNAGLEGSRLGEPSGKALLAISDEVRTQTTRAVELLAEQLTTMGQLDQEQVRLREQVDHARRRAEELAEALQRSVEAQRNAHTTLLKLGRHLRRCIGIDPEVARALAAATDHARGLASALSTLSSRSGRSLVLRALRPWTQSFLRATPQRQHGAQREELER